MERHKGIFLTSISYSFPPFNFMVSSY